MKKTLLRFLVGGLLCSFVGISMANQITIINGTSEQGMLNVTYKVAYAKENGQKPKYGASNTLSVRQSTLIDLQPKQGYKYVGIVPISINGHSLHDNNKFLQPQQCYAATSDQEPYGKLTIKLFLSKDKKHGRITCEHE